MPIRLSKPLYVCAAGEKEKMYYLRLHLFVKVSLSFLFAIVIQKFMAGAFFLSNNWMAVSVQVGLWIFLLLSLNLRTDPGNRREIRKAYPDMDTERSEEVVAGVYWFALLIAECLVLYTMAAMQVEWRLWIFFLWIALLIANFLIARHCTSPILRYMLSYEKMYYPLPDKKE